VPFLGPYRILRKKRFSNTYVVDMGDGGVGQWHASQLVKGGTPGSAFDTPAFLERPQALLACRRDLQGVPRYLTVWDEQGNHSWERAEHLGEVKQGRDLMYRYRRRYSKDIPSTSDHLLLQEHPEWLEEVPA